MTPTCSGRFMGKTYTRDLEKGGNKGFED